MSRTIIRLVAFVALLAVAIPVCYSQELKIGVLAPRGELNAKVRWQAFAEHLSTELGEEVSMVPLPPSQVIEAVDNAKVDFLLSHSPHTVYVREKLGARIMATLETMAGPRFGGVIIARKDSGIRTAGDLKGKHVMSLKFKAAAGAYIFQTYHLLGKGIDPHKDFASLKAGKKQDDLVLAVNNGLIDAAFVRTGLLESMQKEGKISLEDFQVVDLRTDDDFSLLHTTELYPEWCFSALPHVSAEHADRISALLFKLTPEVPAASKAGIKGFVQPLSLEGITRALKALQISPFNG